MKEISSMGWEELKALHTVPSFLKLVSGILCVPQLCTRLGATPRELLQWLRKVFQKTDLKGCFTISLAHDRCMKQKLRLPKPPALTRDFKG